MPNDCMLCIFWNNSYNSDIYRSHGDGKLCSVPLGRPDFFAFLPEMRKAKVYSD